MGTIAADLPGGERCDAKDLERWGRCLGLRDQFAWCGTASTARFAMDTKFPSDASDLARENAETAVLVVILVAMLCCRTDVPSGATRACECSNISSFRSLR